MRNRAVAVVLSLAFSVPLFAAQAASAAIEVGNNCAAKTGTGGYTLVQLAQTGSPLPLAAPTAGVATKWKVNLDPSVPIPTEPALSETMRVLRPTGTPKQFQTIAESSPGSYGHGTSVFDTRIPVQAGDHFGAYAPESSAILFCSTESEADVLGAKKADIGPGSTADYEPAPKIQLALSVTIEPDVDGDGYGDETQDKCPQSAATHDPCPVLLLDAVASSPGKGAVKILVAADSQASITVSASAQLPKTPKKAKAAAVTNLAAIPQLVTPGKISTYTMNYTAKLKQALAALPKSKSIKLTVKAEGKAAGSLTASVDTLTVKLKGQAKSG
jgi:hypothetical protein